MRYGTLTSDKVAELYPRLYHMAEAGSWESIRKRGLLSTTALLDLFEVSGPERDRIEGERRPQKVTITHPVHGQAVIRDQKPMSDAALRKCLSGSTPSEWYRLLNRRVFFWVSRERLFRLLGAKAYRAERQCVITVDTAALLKRHEDRVLLAPINTGSTIMKPQPRSPETFRSIAEYDFEAWSRKRKGREPVVELVVEYAVPDLREFALRAEHVEGGMTTEVLWEAGRASGN